MNVESSSEQVLRPGEQISFHYVASREASLTGFRLEPSYALQLLSFTVGNFELLARPCKASELYGPFQSGASYGINTFTPVVISVANIAEHSVMARAYFYVEST